MLDPRVRVVADAFLDHAARKANPVPMTLVKAKLFGGNTSEIVEWVDHVVSRGKAKVLADGEPLPAWEGTPARATLAQTADEATWARFALDVKT